MRCKYCGSNMIHPETQHKTFSAGKAVAGAVAFGVVGAAAGLIGKDQKGYKCGACGAFMDTPMGFRNGVRHQQCRQGRRERQRPHYV